MTHRWRTAAERRRELEELAAAVGMSMDEALTRIDRVLDALLRERHPDVTAQLVFAGYPVTWEGAAAAVEHFARVGGDALTADILDTVLFTATVSAVQIALP